MHQTRVTFPQVVRMALLVLVLCAPLAGMAHADGPEGGTGGSVNGLPGASMAGNLHVTEAVRNGLPLGVAGGFLALLAGVALVVTMIRKNQEKAPPAAEQSAEMLGHVLSPQISQVLLDSLMEEEAQGVFIKDSAQRFVYANRHIAELYGVTPREMPGKTTRDHRDLSAEQIEALEAADRRVLNDGAIIDEVYTLNTPGRGEVSLRIRKRPLHGGDGGITGLIGIVTNVDDVRRTEKTLLEYKLLAETAQQVASVGFWERNLETGALYWADTTYRIFGLEPGVEITVEDLAGYIHEDDREMFEGVLRKMRESGELMEYAHRIVRADGEVRHVVQRGQSFFNAAGKLSHRVGVIMDVTEQRAQAEAMETLRKRLMLLSENVSEGVLYVDTEQRYRYANRTVASWCGMTPEEMVGRTIAETLSPDSYRRALPNIENALAGNPVNMQTYLDYPDGVARHVKISNFPDVDETGRVVGYTSLSQDVSDLVRAAEDMRKSEEALKRAQRIAKVGHFEWRPKNNSVWLSDEIFPMLGLQSGGFPGSFDALLEHVNADQRFMLRQKMQDALLTGRELRMLVELEGRPAGQRHVDIRGELLLGGSDGEACLVGTFQDVTERVRLERQLTRVQRMEAVGNLTSGVAHEFNNLLQIILGCVMLVTEKGSVDERMGNILKRIREAAERGSGLVRDMIKFSRDRSIQKALLEVNPLLEGMENLILAALRPGITYESRLAGGLPAVFGDEDAIRQMVMNLVQNAGDAMPRGGALFIGTAQLEPDADFRKTNYWASAKRYVVITVRDTGEGILPEHMQRVWDPFFTTRGPQAGTGLGLAMVYGLALQHGGGVLLDSTPGEGTEVRLYLPMPEGDTAGQGPAGTQGGKLVLIADDEESIRFLSSQILRGLHLGFVTANDGAQALQAYETHREALGLLVLDIGMPEVDGLEVLRRVRETSPELPVVICTGYDTDLIPAPVHADPFVRILRKPFTPDELREAVGEWKLPGA